MQLGVSHTSCKQKWPRIKVGREFRSDADLKRGLGSINYKPRHTTIDVLCKDANIKIKTILQVVQFILKKQSEEYFRISVFQARRPKFPRRYLLYTLVFTCVYSRGIWWCAAIDSVLVW